ncbi:MAG: hypothetical protein CNLJKLNK_00014 [Holosporales bacterium]
MNFEEAIKAHSDWKLKLQRYLRSPDGTIDVQRLEKDNLCTLGQWLHTEGKVHAHLPEYQKLIKEHEGFHREAADIVRKKDNGENVTEATSLSSNSPFIKHSVEVVSILMRLKRLIQKN